MRRIGIISRRNWKIIPHQNNSVKKICIITRNYFETAVSNGIKLLGWFEAPDFLIDYTFLNICRSTPVSFDSDVVRLRCRVVRLVSLRAVDRCRSRFLVSNIMKNVFRLILILISNWNSYFHPHQNNFIRIKNWNYILEIRIGGGQNYFDTDNSAASA